MWKCANFLRSLAYTYTLNVKEWKITRNSSDFDLTLIECSLALKSENMFPQFTPVSEGRPLAKEWFENAALSRSEILTNQERLFSRCCCANFFRFQPFQHGRWTADCRGVVGGAPFSGGNNQNIYRWENARWQVDHRDVKHAQTGPCEACVAANSRFHPRLIRRARTSICDSHTGKGQPAGAGVRRIRRTPAPAGLLQPVMSQQRVMSQPWKLGHYAWSCDIMRWSSNR